MSRHFGDVGRNTKDFMKRYAALSFGLTKIRKEKERSRIPRILKIKLYHFYSKRFKAYFFPFLCFLQLLYWAEYVR